MPSASTFAEWKNRFALQESSHRNEMDSHSILADGQREQSMILAAESHAAMRQRTRQEVLDMNRQARANGAMLAVQPWETKI